jgi:uncharacterized membrane-anchored protein
MTDRTRDRQSVRSFRKQSSGSNADLLDHKDRGDHPRRNRRRYRDNDAELGLPDRNCYFLSASVALVGIQIFARRFHPFLYWATIVASTTFGTAMADFADRSLGIGYAGGSLSLFLCLIAVLGLWKWSLGSISVDTVSRPPAEAFYWAAITLSQTLGTALGDWTADDTGLGYNGAAIVFAAAIALVAAAYFWTNVSRVFLFWIAFILTRPLGATAGDYLDKPVSEGGLALSRPIASLVLAGFILACIIILPQRAGRHPGQATQTS